MGNVISIGDYKLNDEVQDLINSIADELYTKCMDSIKDCDVYTYVDMDIVSEMVSRVDSLDISEELHSGIFNYLIKKGGIYNNLYTLGLLGDSDLESRDILMGIVEDILSTLLMSDGFKVCFKLVDEEDISIWDGENLIELDSSNVFNRIITKALEGIPYELIYIR